MEQKFVYAWVNAPGIVAHLKSTFKKISAQLLKTKQAICRWLESTDSWPTWPVGTIKEGERTKSFAHAVAVPVPFFPFFPQRNSPWAHILRFFSTRFVSNTDKGLLNDSPTPMPHPGHSRWGGDDKDVPHGEVPYYPFFCSHKWYQGQLFWKCLVEGGRRPKRAPHHIGFTSHEMFGASVTPVVARRQGGRECSCKGVIFWHYRFFLKSEASSFF